MIVWEPKEERVDPVAADPEHAWWERRFLALLGVCWALLLVWLAVKGWGVWQLVEGSR